LLKKGEIERRESNDSPEVRELGKEILQVFLTTD